MPTYDLLCCSCDEAFEVFRQGFLREEDRACESCGSTDVEQLFTGFVLAEPARQAARTAGGGCCGGSCGCGAG